MSGNRSKSAFFGGGLGHFERRFQREGASSTNHCWCQKTRVIAVSCGTKISTVHHLVLSQYTRLTRGGTDEGASCEQGHAARENQVGASTKPSFILDGRIKCVSSAPWVI